MPIITIISDWNNNDFYVGAVKGRLLSLIPEATIIDISHMVMPKNMAQAAFIMRNCYKQFPKNTIHLICIDTDKKNNNNKIIVCDKGQYFIGADNGIYSLITNDGPEKVYRIKDNIFKEKTTFPELYEFTEIAAYIVKDNNLNKIAEETTSYEKLLPLRPQIEESLINGNIIYIDSYYNAVSNITHDLFSKIGKGRKFEILVQSYHYRITTINKFYSDSIQGDLLAVFNSLGLLEIAINNGKATELLNLKVGSEITIKFK